MTDKEIALELTKTFLNHQNAKIAAGHQHTDLDQSGVQGTYKMFYDLVANIDESK